MYKLLTFVLWIYLVDRTSSEPCRNPAEINDIFSISETNYNISKPFEWFINDTSNPGGAALQCEQGAFCYQTFGAGLRYGLLMTSMPAKENGDFNNDVRMNLTGVSLSDDGVIWSWSLNGSLIGECGLQVFSFDAPLTCGDIVNLRSKVSWSCQVKGVFPKARCLVENQHQEQSDDASGLNTTLTHTINADGYYDTVCTVVISEPRLNAGYYRLKMTMQPDVNQGIIYGKSQVTKDFIMVHIGDLRDELYNNIPFLVTMGLLFLSFFGSFGLGFYIGKKKYVRKLVSFKHQHELTSVDDWSHNGVTATQTPAGNTTNRANDYLPCQSVSKQQKKANHNQQQQKQKQQQHQESAIYLNNEEDDNIYADPDDVLAMNLNPKANGEGEKASKDPKSKKATSVATVNRHNDHESTKNSKTKAATKNLKKGQQQYIQSTSPNKAFIPSSGMKTKTKSQTPNTRPALDKPGDEYVQPNPPTSAYPLKSNDNIPAEDIIYEKVPDFQATNKATTTAAINHGYDCPKSSKTKMTNLNPGQSKARNVSHPNSKKATAPNGAMKIKGNAKNPVTNYEETYGNVDPQQANNDNNDDDGTYYVVPVKS